MHSEVHFPAVNHPGAVIYRKCRTFLCVQWSAETRLENSVHSFRALRYLPRSSTGARTVTFLCVQWSAETRLENSVHSFCTLRYLPQLSIGARTVTFLCVQWSAETRLENFVHSFRALRYLHGCILNCTFWQLIYRGRFCHKKCKTGSITVTSRTDNAINILDIDCDIVMTTSTSIRCHFSFHKHLKP